MRSLQNTPEAPKNELSSVGMHGAFWRDGEFRDSEIIQYPKLEEHVEVAADKEYGFLRAFWDSPEGSADELRYARRAAEAYLVRTGALLRTGDNEQKQLVSDRFTQASIEMYGQPDKTEAAKLAALQLVEFRSLVGNDDVDQVRLKNQIEYFENQVGGIDLNSAESADFSETLVKIGEVLNKRYGHILQLFDLPGRDKISAVEVQQLFQQAIESLSQEDPAWKGWVAENAKSSAMDADTRTKKIRVGNTDRETSRLKGSFIHEVLAHALSAVSGSKTGDDYLEHGTPGSHDAIEGLAVFLSAAERGSVSDRSKDFYIDIAFALGQFGERQISRPDLHKLYLDRLIIRKQANGQRVNEEALSRKAWAYVNRIYRGTLGNDIIGVNTIDAAYYSGFLKIAPFAKQQLEAGKTADEVFDYLVSARFDPTNPKDREYVDGVWAKTNQKTEEKS